MRAVVSKRGVDDGNQKTETFSSQRKKPKIIYRIIESSAFLQLGGRRSSFPRSPEYDKQIKLGIAARFEAGLLSDIFR